MKHNTDVAEMLSNYKTSISKKIDSAIGFMYNDNKEMAKNKLKTAKSLTETMIKKFEDSKNA